jgi:hypothetical protein
MRVGHQANNQTLLPQNFKHIKKKWNIPNFDKNLYFPVMQNTAAPQGKLIIKNESQTGLLCGFRIFLEVLSQTVTCLVRREV